MSSRLVARIVRGPTPPCRRLYSRSPILTWTAYLGAAISALSAHRPTERRSLGDAEGEGAVSVSTREDNVTLPAPHRAEPSRAGRPPIDRKVSRVRASRSLTRAVVRRAVQSRVCTRMCAKFVRRCGTKMLLPGCTRVFSAFLSSAKLFQHWIEF